MLTTTLRHVLGHSPYCLVAWHVWLIDPEVVTALYARKEELQHITWPTLKAEITLYQTSVFFFFFAESLGPGAKCHPVFTVQCLSLKKADFPLPVFLINVLAFPFAVVPGSKDLLSEAENLHMSALKLAIATFGEKNVQTAKHFGNLGRLYQSMKKFQVWLFLCTWCPKSSSESKSKLKWR